MGGISADAIRKRAYQIWEREGRPHGRDFDHWVQAQVELMAEVATESRARAVAPPPRPTPTKAAPPKPSRSAPAGPARAKKRA